MFAETRRDGITDNKKGEDIMETLKNIGIALWATFPIWGSVAFVLLKKFWKPADNYLNYLASILGIADDITDRLVLEFPNNSALNTIDDIVDKVIQELKDAGYDTTTSEREIENHVKANIGRKNGISVDKDGTIHFQVNKKF